MGAPQQPLERIISSSRTLWLQWKFMMSLSATLRFQLRDCFRRCKRSPILSKSTWSYAHAMKNLNSRSFRRLITTIFYRRSTIWERLSPKSSLSSWIITRLLSRLPLSSFQCRPEPQVAALPAQFLVAEVRCSRRQLNRVVCIRTWALTKFYTRSSSTPSSITSWGGFSKTSISRATWTQRLSCSPSSCSFTLSSLRDLILRATSTSIWSHVTQIFRISMLHNLNFSPSQPLTKKRRMKTLIRWGKVLISVIWKAMRVQLKIPLPALVHSAHNHFPLS